MLALNDPRWTELTSGYRLPYDPRPLLETIADAPHAEASWSEVWDELHHQGDLGTASYAVVPTLVSLFLGQRRHWEFYAYLSLLELQRRHRSNPPVPDWLATDYHGALVTAKRLALADLAESSDPLLLRTALNVVAFAVGELRLGALMCNLDDSEVEELLEDRLDWTTDYRDRAG